MNRVRLIVFIFMAMLMVACSENQTVLVKGQPTSTFSLKNLQQKTVSYPGDFTDKIVLISFWADWCPSCKGELRDFEVIYQKYRGQGLAVIAINIDQDKQTAMAFIDDLNLSYEVLLDDKGDVAKRYAIASLPSAMIIGRGGKLHTRLLGETPAKVFEEIIASLL